MNQRTTNNKQKFRKKHIDLGPLNLSKTQYRPYIRGHPHRGKENIRTMGPLENIMFDIPPIEEPQSQIQITSTDILRNKISKCFEQISNKFKQQWLFYIKKSELLKTVSHAWSEIEKFLLKIILELLQICKGLSENNNELQRSKEEITQNMANIRSSEQQKTYIKFRTTNISKIDNSLNDYTNFAKNFSFKSNMVGKNEYKQPSFYVNSQDISPNMQDNQNHLQFKVSKLQKQIQLYQQRVKNLEEEYQQKFYEKEKEIQNKIGAKYNETIQQKMKFENEVESKRFYNDILAQEFKILRKKYLQQEEELITIRNQCNRLKQKNQKLEGLYQYRQLWLMEHEEILEMRQQLRLLKQEKQGEIKKNKGLKQKLKELSKNYHYNYNLSVENERDRQDLNKVLKDFRDWLKFFAVPRVSKGLMNNNTFFPEMTFDTGKDNYSNFLPNDDETDYKLLRPNFFIYFEAYEGIIMAERKFPQRKVMPPSFYLTIRAILDSMYLHFNFTTDFKQWSNFPEFAISFIQKFEINLDTKKLRPRKIPCQSEQKINFLLNVFNIEAANTWECEIFRGFIMEEFTLDEIYFYLECRDNLLRGSQLDNNFGSFDSIVYIRISTAEEVIKQKLKNYDRQMFQRMKKFLNSKKKIKNNRQLIDVNFVLKLLLEVYSIQKIKSERFFHHNFKSKNPSTKISYTEYSAFMTKNFEFLTKIDIARLYREMYTLGVSHITYKTIHYVCSMRGLFIPLLRAKMSKHGIWGQPKNQKPFQDILYLDIQNNLNNMVAYAQQYGVEEIIDANICFNKFLHDSQNLRLNRANFEHKLLLKTEKILKIKSILNWKHEKNLDYQQISKDEIRQRLTQLLLFIHQSNENITAIRKNKEYRSKALLKIVRNFKIRIQESMAEFRAINKKEYEDKISKVEDTEKKIQNEPESQKQVEIENENDQA